VAGGREGSSPGFPKSSGRSTAIGEKDISATHEKMQQSVVHLPKKVKEI
jgi:hypothetical protein